MKNNQGLEILGIGNPILDHLLCVKDQYLDEISGEKYGMETVVYEEMVAIIENSGTIPTRVTGGSCANAIKGLAALGRKCALIGKVGHDASAEKIVDKLRQIGVIPLLLYSALPTARVVCLITPDGKRTCRAFLGAAKEMRPDDLELEHFANTRLVHIEGYSFLYPGLAERAMELAKQKGAVVSLDLGSFEVVAGFKTMMHDLIKDYVDIVFANTDEIFALTGLNPKEGCIELGKMSSIAVVMMGIEGCWVADATSIAKYRAYPVEPVDTTGAGDLFASGFLHGYLSGKSLAVSAKWGAIVAKEVVRQIGAEIPQKQWEMIKSLL